MRASKRVPKVFSTPRKYHRFETFFLFLQTQTYQLKTKLMEKRIKKNNRQMEAVNDRIITLRGQQVIIDRDVAELYGVETKRVNEALKNNREKFPKGYVITLQPTEKQ